MEQEYEIGIRGEGSLSSLEEDSYAPTPVAATPVIDNKVTDTKQSQSFRPKETVWASGELLGTAGTAMGSMAMSGLGALSYFFNSGFKHAAEAAVGNPNIPQVTKDLLKPLAEWKLPEDVSAAMKESGSMISIYSPKSPLGQQSLSKAASLIETVDSYIQNVVAGDSIEKGMEYLNKVESSLRGTPTVPNKEATVLLQTSAYTAAQFLPIAAIGKALKKGISIPYHILNKSPLTKDDQDMLRTLSDIRQQLGSGKNAEHILGPDNRPVKEALADSVNTTTRIELSDDTVDQAGNVIEGGKTKLFRIITDNVKSLKHDRDYLAFIRELKTNTPLDTIPQKIAASLIKDNPEMGKEVLVHSPRFNDLPAGWSHPGRQVNIPFFIQNVNPIVKKGMDLLRGAANRTKNSVEELAFGTRILPGKSHLGLSTLRHVRGDITPNGALYHFIKLSDFSKAKVVKELVARDLTPEKVELTGNIYGAAAKRNVHLTPHEEAAIKGIRRYIDTILGETDAQRALAGFNPLKMRRNYLMRPVTGDFRLRVFVADYYGNKQGKYIYHRGFNSEYEANKFYRDTFDPNQTTSRISRVDTSYGNERRVANETIEELLGPEATQVDVQKYLLKKAKEKHGASITNISRRSHAGGYDYDPALFIGDDKGLVKAFEKALLNYGTSMSKNNSRLAMADEWTKLLNSEEAKLYPNSVRYLEEMHGALHGKQTNLNSAFNRTFDHVFDLTAKYTLGKINPYTVNKGLDVVSKGITTLKLLTMNPRYLLTTLYSAEQLASVNMAKWVAMGVTDPKEGNASIIKAIAEAEKALHINPSAEELDVLNYFVHESRIASPSFLHQFSFEDSSSTLRPKTRFQKIRDYPVTGMYLKSEEYVRAKTGMMYYKFLRNSGYEHDAAKKVSAYQANHTQVDYTQIEKANIYANNLSKPFGKFNHWGHNVMMQEAEVYKLLAEKASSSDPAAMSQFGVLASAKLANIAAFGATSVFGVYYVDKLLNSLGADTNLTEWMYDNLPDWVSMGATSEVTGYNPSMGGPDVRGPSFAIPDFLTEVGASIASLEQNDTSITNWIFSMILGAEDPTMAPTREEVARFVKATTPIITHGHVDSWAATGSLKFWDLKEGVFYNFRDLARGKEIQKYFTKKDAIHKFWTFTSIDERKRFVRDMQAIRKAMKQSDETKALITSMADLVLSDYPIPSYYADRLGELGYDSKQARTAIEKEIESQLFSINFLAAIKGSMSPDTRRRYREMLKNNPGQIDELFEQLRTLNINKPTLDAQWRKGTSPVSPLATTPSSDDIDLEGSPFRIREQP